MPNYAAESLKLHKKLRGKLTIRSKQKIKNRHDLSLLYTPGVAEAVRAIARDPKLVRDLTIKNNTVAIVTDGSAILGLGNLGPAAALPVMEGKAMLFKELAGIDAFPICLATQDTEEIIRTVKNIAPVFGGINLEDIAAPRCFEIEERLKQELDIPVLHDDQWGTAVVVLAGLINAMKVAGKKLDNSWVTVNGAGAAGIAIIKLLHLYAPKVRILALDSQGVIWHGRKGLNSEKKALIEKKMIFAEEAGDLHKALIESDVFIGVSKPGVLKAKDIKVMNEKPIVFALANPIPEIMPDIAKQAGAFIVATGRSDFSNQINNVLAFPGIFRGALDHGVKQITEDMLLKAAQALASSVKKPTVHYILPHPLDKKVAQIVARAIR